MLSMGGQRIDTRSPTGKLMLTMLGAIATFERDLMPEREREGIAKAAAEGKYKGRAPIARAKAANVLQMAGAGAALMRSCRRASSVKLCPAKEAPLLNRSGTP